MFKWKVMPFGQAEKGEFMQETLQYLGLDIAYGWWTPAACKADPLVDAKVRHETPRKDAMMYVVSLGPATSTAATSRILPTPAPS